MSLVIFPGRANRSTRTTVNSIWFEGGLYDEIEQLIGATTNLGSDISQRGNHEAGFAHR
jgi:hypothetical protein